MAKAVTNKNEERWSSFLRPATTIMLSITHIQEGMLTIMLMISNHEQE